MSKQFTVKPVPELIDLTHDEEGEVVGPEVLGPQTDQRGAPSPIVADEPQILFQNFPQKNGRRPVQLVVATLPQPEVQQQQQQQQQQQVPEPQPGPSGVENWYITENYSSAESEADEDSDNPFVNLGQGRKCHISRWVKYVRDMDFDIYGPDAMEEYLSDSEAEEAKIRAKLEPAEKKWLAFYFETWLILPMNTYFKPISQTKTF